MMALPPDQVPGSSDVGADTLQRYRHQATYAAIVSLAMLDADGDIAELFCEHHEDILVKHRDEKFVGYQVKTKAVGLGPFKAGDDVVLKSLAHFINLQVQFASHFKHFVFASNCGCWREKKDGSCLPHLLELAASANLEATRWRDPLGTFLGKLADQSGKPKKHVLATLQKVRTTEIPGLADIEAKLVQHLGACPRCATRSVADVTRVARQLIEAMLRAGSHGNSLAMMDYFSLLNDPDGMRNNALIQGRRITKEVVSQVIEEALPPEGLFCTAGHVPLSDLPKGMKIMETKMAVGGISLGDIQLAKDHRASAEKLLLEWSYKYSTTQAAERYEHLKTLVLTEAQEAHNATRNPRRLFGQAMLAEVQRRLRARFDADRARFLGSSYEHALGIAGMATEECRLWWSREFDIPKEGSS